jgi:hypothetical protein
VHKYTKCTMYTSDGGDRCMKSLSPTAWNGLYRLAERKNNAIDLDYVHRIASPLCVTSDPEKCDAGFAEVNGGYIVSVFMQIVVTSSVTLSSVGFEADWRTSAIKWADRCPDHSSCCYHPHFSFPLSNVLHRMLWRPDTRLKRGQILRGLCLGWCAGEPPQVSPGSPLPAILVVEDVMGNKFRYPVVCGCDPLYPGKTPK